MSDSEYAGQRRFRRDRANGMILGVCAGVADYFGFNLRATRLLAVIGLFVAMPATLLLYFGIAFLVPAMPRESRQSRASRPERDEFRQALRSSPKATMADVRRRFQRLDARLARMERYVTSPRFNLDREIRNL
jgi:phage shock protein C